MNTKVLNVFPRSRGLRSRSGGLSLVEMMVALTVGLVLLAGLMQVWSSSRKTYRLAEAQSRIQENGRYAAQMLASELRATRSPACQSVALGEALDSINVTACSLLNPAAGNPACTGGSVVTATLAMGFDASQSGAGGWLDALPGNDAAGAQQEVKDRWLRGDIVVGWGVLGDGVYVDAPGGITANRTGTVDVQKFSNELDPGSLVLITDCKSADIFEVTGANPMVVGQPSSLSFALGANANASGQLSYAYNWRGGHLAAGPKNRARVFPFEYKVLFVCCMDADSGDVQSGAANVALCNTNDEQYRPALCRWSTADNSEPRQLVANVADMRVTYDGASGNSRFRDETDDPDSAWVEAQGLWDSVDSLRVQLLATWDEQVLSEESRPNGWQDNQSGDLGFGMDEDRRLYQVFDLTTATRSSAPWYVQ